MVGFFTDGSIAEDLALVAVDSSSLTGRFSKCEHVEDTCREVFHVVERIPFI